MSEEFHELNALLHAIRKRTLPRHIALIMDGNGRWALRQGQPRVHGHRVGAERVSDVVELALDLAIPYVTLFTFSMENWYRPPEEVNALMNLLEEAIETYWQDAVRLKVRLFFLGDRTRLPSRVRRAIEHAEQATRVNTRLTLTLALSYSGRWEITETTRRILQNAGRIHPAVVTEEFWQACMPSAHLPPVDLLIRTGGEYRISNFTLWQAAYAEFYFTDVLWPEFTKVHLAQAILHWQQRERRFGRVPDYQVYPARAKSGA